MTMTNPPPPPASAMGLPSKWLKDRAKTYPSDSSTQTGYNAALKDCADELAAALSLSEEEREAIRYMDSERANAGMTRAVFSASTRDYDTLRALIARVTDIGEVK